VNSDDQTWTKAPHVGIYINKLNTLDTEVWQQMPKVPLTSPCHAMPSTTMPCHAIARRYYFQFDSRLI
jgi:hypothetical protein